MTKKNASSYKVVVPSSLVDLSSLHVAFAYNESRKGIRTFKGLLGMTKGKTPIVGPGSQTLLTSMLVRGFDTVEIMITTDIGLDAASQKRDIEAFRKESSAQLEEIKSLPLFKGEKGSFTYKGVEVEMTAEDFAAEWERTFPLTVKGKPRITEKTEAVISGNRRTVVLVLRNAIVRKAGYPQDVVTQVRREKRSYASLRDRKDDSVYLNEKGKEGKLESTKLQKLAVGFGMIDDGCVQADFNKVFAGNRGAVQLGFEIPACVRIVSWVDKEAAKDIRESLLAGTTPMPNQGKLKRLRGMRMQAEHSDGHSEEFRTQTAKKRANAYNPETHLGHGMIAAHKAHVLAHPEIAERLKDYFLNIRDPEWVDPETGKATSPSSVASATLQSVAANCGNDLVETLLNVCAGADTSYEVKDVAAAVISELDRRTIRLRNSKGELTGEPLTQEDFDPIQAKAEKAKSGRRRKSG